MTFTPEEIRNSGVSGFATHENRAVVEVLVEIAAQLAELNQNAHTLIHMARTFEEAE